MWSKDAYLHWQNWFQGQENNLEVPSLVRQQFKTRKAQEEEEGTHALVSAWLHPTSKALSLQLHFTTYINDWNPPTHPIY